MIPQEEIDILMGMEEKEAKMANRYDPVGRTEGMSNSVCDNLRNAYERGYKDGRADAQATDAQIIELGQKIENEAYERGYKDGQKEINDKYRIQMDDGTFKRMADAIEKDAYDRGYKDGQRDTESDNALANGFALAQREKGRDEGRREAWEAMEKIVLGECDGGIAFDTLQKIFGFGYMSDICRRYTVDEVIEKLAAYEKQKVEEKKKAEEEIKVGDEVLVSCPNEQKCVVVGVHDNETVRLTIMRKDGACYSRSADGVKKTWRTFPEIAEVLKQMQEG